MCSSILYNNYMEKEIKKNSNLDLCSSATSVFSGRKTGKWRSAKRNEEEEGGKRNAGRQEGSKEPAAPAQMARCRRGLQIRTEAAFPFPCLSQHCLIPLCASTQPPVKSCLWIETSKNNIVPEGCLSHKYGYGIEEPPRSALVRVRSPDSRMS